MTDDKLSRRDFWVAGGAALTAATLIPGMAAADDTEKPDLKYEWLYDITAELEPPQMVGGAMGNRMIFMVKSGRVEGPKIKADVLPGGGDWLRMRADGVSELDVRGSVKTDDGVIIYTHYTGLSHNKTPDGSRYFRITPRFETSSEKYAWLNNIIAVGYGWSSGTNQVSYRVFQIL